MGDSQPRRLEERLARELGLALLMTGVAVVQVTLLSTPLGFSAPLLLVLVVCRTLVGVGSAFPDNGVSTGMRWALYGGLALDLLAATPIGSHALALLLAALAVAAATRRLSVERPIIPLLAVLVGAAIYEVVLALATQPAAIEWRSYARVVVMPVVLSALIPTLPIFFLLRWALRGEL